MALPRSWDRTDSTRSSDSSSVLLCRDAVAASRAPWAIAPSERASSCDRIPWAGPSTSPSGVLWYPPPTISGITTPGGSPGRSPGLTRGASCPTATPLGRGSPGGAESPAKESVPGVAAPSCRLPRMSSMSSGTLGEGDMLGCAPPGREDPAADGRGEPRSATGSENESNNILMPRATSGRIGDDPLGRPEACTSASLPDSRRAQHTKAHRPALATSSCFKEYFTALTRG